MLATVEALSQEEISKRTEARAYGDSLTISYRSLIASLLEHPEFIQYLTSDIKEYNSVGTSQSEEEIGNKKI